MPELLLELGCEELPATFVAQALHDLQNGIESRLRDANVEFTRVHEPIGTPRRLIIHLEAAERQPDQTKEQRGPGIKAAYDADGNPTPALQGFCRGQGIDPSDVRKEGDYVWFTKTITGRDTQDLLAEIIPASVRAMTFEKAMRWGSSRMRFARPIRWILAAFGGGLIPFEIEGVASGLESRGHRFNAPDPFMAHTREELVTGLRDRQVEPEPAAREERIRNGAVGAASGEPEMPAALVAENVFLTEWPSALEGSFKEEYLDLPEPVLVTAMAKHERFFPVRDRSGKLLNRFISIRNGGEEETVRSGNEWVLNARFNDAKFFFDEDAKTSLDGFLEKTSGILFQEKLGTVRERATRLANTAVAVARATGADERELEFASRAGLLCKADLTTGLVSELPSLQGLIGGEYARREGLPEEVCSAIASHYDLKKVRNPQDAAARTAARVLIADQLDKLAGYLGLGLAPSGSSDPFGLRRAVTLLIEVAWSWNSLPVDALDYGELLTAALMQYRQAGHPLDPTSTWNLLEEVFAGRYPSMMPQVRHDIMDAALNADLLRPRRMQLKIRALEELANETQVVFAATRPINIVAAARNKDIRVPEDVQIEVFDTPRLQSEDGVRLAEAVRAAEQGLHQAVRGDDAGAMAEHIRKLAEPIDTFFDSTMVMVEDADVRDARLALLQVTSQVLFAVGDFTKIVIEGQMA